MRLTALTLTHFRNLAQLQVAVAPGAQVVALIGPNGVGKTSVLEAISLLAGGKGLDGADSKEQTQHKATSHTVVAEVARAGDEPLKLALQVAGGVKTVKIDGAPATPAALAHATARAGGIVWLTPVADRLFYGPPATRREQLDDWAAWVVEAHEEAAARYKTHLTNRLRLLRGGSVSTDFLAAEEAQAAQFGIALLRGRLAYLAQLNRHAAGLALALSGSAQEILAEPDPVAALAGKFARTRELDARLERTHAGPNTLDVAGELTLGTGQTVALHVASSGQHKRAVCAWLLAQVQLMHATRGTAPLVLLDEAGAHLDANRRLQLLESLTTLGAQVWLSDTELPAALASHPGLQVVQLA